MEQIIDGLTKEDMDWQPRPDCNSIGWTLWHLTRQQDAQIAAIMGEDQLWIREEWYLKFNRAADNNDTGFRHTSEQVSEFKSPNVHEFLNYQRAVRQRTFFYFKSIMEIDLDRELNEPWFQPLPTVGIRLISILSDSLMHLGQAAYIRGLKEGKGWQSY